VSPNSLPPHRQPRNQRAPRHLRNSICSTPSLPSNSSSRHDSSSLSTICFSYSYYLFLSISKHHLCSSISLLLLHISHPTTSHVSITSSIYTLSTSLRPSSNPTCSIPPSSSRHTNHNPLRAHPRATPTSCSLPFRILINRKKRFQCDSWFRY
jgi:hypothetical protein